MNPFLAASEIVDWHDENILACSRRLRATTEQATARACFQWVRDEIPHSFDQGRSEVACRASDVLRAGTGICFAKSHLLAALLRANGILAGFGYQRLCLDDQGPPHALHGFNFVHLTEFGWVAADARGNRPGLTTEFSPPAASLAFHPSLPGEITFPHRFAEPLPVVVHALQQATTVQQLQTNLPDCTAAEARSLADAIFPPHAEVRG